MDVLLFDQFGNYVIQTMLDVAVKAKKGEHGGNNFWFERLAERIITTQHKLIRYSSGKKILEKLSAVIFNYLMFLKLKFSSNLNLLIRNCRQFQTTKTWFKMKTSAQPSNHWLFRKNFVKRIANLVDYSAEFRLASDYAMYIPDHI